MQGGRLVWVAIVLGFSGQHDVPSAGLFVQAQDATISLKDSPALKQ